MTRLNLAIIGAGIGGLTAAAALRRIGIGVEIFEQAARFARVGAGIQQSPNAMKVLRRLGLEPRLRELAFQPPAMVSKLWDSGEVTTALPLGRAAEEQYGAPYLLMHRGDLHAALAATVPDDIVHRDKRLVGIDQSAHGVTLAFADGTRVTADAVIGADGVHSTVREILLGAAPPRFTGKVGYRTTFPAARLGDARPDDNTKWWGPDRHIVVYYTNPRRDEVYFVTATPEPDFHVESWSAKGDLKVLRDAYAGFHPEIAAVLAACPDAHKWALVERDPLPRWGEGRIVLLGDACHPMTPWMAQGAAMSIEDGAVLSRCLAEVEPDGIPAAFRRFEATRKERTSRVQAISSANTFMRAATETGWVYGYDAWEAPLATA